MSQIIQQMIGLLLSVLLLVACGTSQPTLKPTLIDTLVPTCSTGQLIWMDIPAFSLENNLLGDLPENLVVATVLRNI